MRPWPRAAWIAIASLHALTGCTKHVVAVRPIDREKELEINRVVSLHDATVKIQGEEAVERNVVGLSGPILRLRQLDPGSPPRVPRWLPETETSVRSVESIIVRNDGRAALQGLGIGAITGALATSVVVAVLATKRDPFCESGCPTFYLLIELSGIAFSALTGTVVGVMVGSPTFIHFQDAPSPDDQQRCAPLAPNVAHKGARIYEGAHPMTRIIAKLDVDTPVCASSESIGNGFRRVKFPDGVEGFAKGSDLSR
jgi:hypothetical protein